MRAVLILSLLIIGSCQAQAPQIAPILPISQPVPIPQTGEMPARQDMPAPGWIDHHPATGHLVV
jgi:hypothetical protein